VLATATPVSLLGTTTTTPTFQWQDPTLASYLVALRVSQQTCCGDMWSFEPLAQGRTSATYSSDGSGAPLVSGTGYGWNVRIVDPDGNTSECRSSFQAQ